MKLTLIVATTLIFACSLGCAQITDPLADFKRLLDISPGDKILKWECRLGGEGVTDMLFSLKSDFEKANQNDQPPSWVFYIAESSIGNYIRSTGTEEKADSLSVDDLPQINPEICYIGWISELGKRGVVTMRTNVPRSGETILIVYAYTVEGNHLKRSELGRYNPREASSALFDKYLADDKRTRVHIQELLLAVQSTPSSTRAVQGAQPAVLPRSKDLAANDMPPTIPRKNSSLLWVLGVGVLIAIVVLIRRR